ncbi:DUF1778 domain-containing protein [Providencia alcalifaciens]|uniref:type II toxin-antitoxin system TacA family antitoxin n=1 Tax=Providencia alcalifaciens TaxID=126385 RepID=UPI001CC73747|nr:DUF1778 domain-containing protein [Providencia alcalifaciens]CAG9415618.1 hypothetical protein NVI2019_GHJFPKLH_01282 [Providencia alcalifaciens]
MLAPKTKRIDLRLNEEDKNLIEEAAAITNLSISQFMINIASERASEIVNHHRRLILNENSWDLVQNAINNPPAVNNRLKQAAKRLQDTEE